MVVIGLTQQASTDAELTALTQVSLTNGQIVWHNGQDSAFMYYLNHNVGDLIPNDQVNNMGVWKKEPNIKGLNLQEYKALRFKEIDDRTGGLISNGFTYKGLVFSLSQNAQINILGMDSTRDDAAITYPIEYSTIDDLAHYSVTDATDLHSMYLTALGTKKYFVDTGTVLKDAIRAAVDEAEVELIIDNR